MRYKILIITITLPSTYSFQNFQSPLPVPSSSNEDTRHLIPRLQALPKTISTLGKYNPFSTSSETEEITLENLGLENDSKPRTYYIKSSEFINIVTASFPLLFRLGSIFGRDYKVSLVPKDETKYTALTIGNFQIEETASKPTVSATGISTDPIVIYEFESCPFCRKVREAVSMLSLEVEYRPCPQDSFFRSEIKEKYGNDATFPIMMDPRYGVELFESAEIIAYLYKFYGGGIKNIPSSLTGGSLTAFLGLLGRLGRGSTTKPSDPPPIPLILWSSEGSPFSKLVREELCELQIPHLQISCPRGSPNRQKLFEKTGTFQVPYLEDPNNGISLFESYTIVEYLQKLYQVKPSPVRYL